MLAPTTEEQLAEAIRNSKEPLAIQGGATRGLNPEGAPLTTSNLTGITLYEPGALTLVAKSGTPVVEIEAALAAEKQMLAFEPMDHRALLGTTGEPTIGGVVATNTSGPRRVKAGACRDLLLGVRFVDGSGTVLKNGGRVMKNVTGYDLARLMCGAHGTLGVLSEVSLKVLPRPEFTATLVYEGPSPEQTCRLLTEAMKTPYDVSGAARLPGGDLFGNGAALLRLEGFEESVKYRAERLAAALGAEDCRVETDPAQCARIWAAVRDVAPFASREGDVWSVSVKPTDFIHIAALATPEDMAVDWSCGRIWMLTESGTDLREKLKGIGGHATLVRGSGHPRFHPEPAPLAKMAADLRAKFDPRGILNPGLMG